MVVLSQTDASGADGSPIPRDLVNLQEVLPASEELHVEKTVNANHAAEIRDMAGNLWIVEGSIDGVGGVTRREWLLTSSFLHAEVNTGINTKGEAEDDAWTGTAVTAAAAGWEEQLRLLRRLIFLMSCVASPTTVYHSCKPCGLAAGTFRIARAAALACQPDQRGDTTDNICVVCGAQWRPEQPA